MADKDFIAPPDAAQALAALGERLVLARKRRRMTAEEMARRACISVPTLRSLERGGAGAGVGIGAYLAVLTVLGMDKDLDSVAADDQIGHKMQDMRLNHRRL